jgi:bacillithiol system protein YtxJ
MNWIQLTTEEQIDKISEQSKTKPVLIFKYSSRCSICDRVQYIMEGNWNTHPKENEEKITPYFLNLIKYRNVSNEVARKFKVMHESPQAIVIKDGEAVYAESHGYISLDDILKSI